VRKAYHDRQVTRRQQTILGRFSLSMKQLEVREAYVKPEVQWFIAFLIIGNFTSNCVEKQIDPWNRRYPDTWFQIETIWNSIFIVELLWNMYGCFYITQWKGNFFSSGWNLFDFLCAPDASTRLRALFSPCPDLPLRSPSPPTNGLSGVDLARCCQCPHRPAAKDAEPLCLDCHLRRVVSVSIPMMTGADLGEFFGQLRMLRAFRVFRLFKRIKSLNKILVSLGRAVPGIINAAVVMFIVMCVHYPCTWAPLCACRRTQATPGVHPPSVPSSARLPVALCLARTQVHLCYPRCRHVWSVRDRGRVSEHL
jgi:hypothetical protein